jgi:hypothetical protein
MFLDQCTFLILDMESLRKFEELVESLAPLLSPRKNASGILGNSVITNFSTNGISSAIVIECMFHHCGIQRRLSILLSGFCWCQSP